MSNSYPSSRVSGRARRATALVLLGSGLLGSMTAPAAEVAPTVSVAHTVLNLYHDGLDVADDACSIDAQGADGRFDCTTGKGYALAGQVIGITNTFGAVVANKFTFTLKVSGTVEERYTGAILRVKIGGDLFAAGTYANSTVKVYPLANGSTMRVTYVADPLPFAADVRSIGG